MDRKKEDLSIFEQMGGTYTEKEGILYPNIRVGREETEQDTFSGKYGDLWKKYLKENQSDRYYHLVLTRQLKQKAVEVNEEANELLDRIMQQYLQKCQCELQLLQICRTVKKCGRLYSWNEKKQINEGIQKTRPELY